MTLFLRATVEKRFVGTEKERGKVIDLIEHRSDHKNTNKPYDRSTAERKGQTLK